MSFHSRFLRKGIDFSGGFLYNVNKTYLLKNGADVNARYPDGETALQKINKDIENYGPDGYRYDEDLYNKFLKIRALLLKYGAK